MDLYKELPSTKLQVLLVTEISNTLQIKKNKMPWHLLPALKGNDKESVPAGADDRSSTDISKRRWKKDHCGVCFQLSPLLTQDSKFLFIP